MFQLKPSSLGSDGAPGTFKGFSGKNHGRRGVEAESPGKNDMIVDGEFPRQHHGPRETISNFIRWATMEEKDIMHAQDKASSVRSSLLLLYRRRCGSRSLVGWGPLRSYSGVYLASIPIRGSGAVLAGYAIPEVAGE